VNRWIARVATPEPSGYTVGMRRGASLLVLSFCACTQTAKPDGGLDASLCDIGGLAAGEFQGCLDDTGCNCPYACIADSLRGHVCEQACTTSSDCAIFYESCQGGACALVFCGQPLLADAGANGLVDGPCNFVGNADGTCMPQSQGQTPLCIPGGTARTNCAALFTSKLTAADLCPPGQGCLVVDGGDRGRCARLCDPTIGRNSCPPGGVCAPTDATHRPQLGVCMPEGAGGCAEGLPTVEWQECGPGNACGCPGLCVTDPANGAQVTGAVCEVSCTATTDCPDLGTHCVDGLCRVNYCGTDLGGQPAPGHFDGPCDAAGRGDGLCLPGGLFTDAGQAVGVCVQEGVATVGCDSSLTHFEVLGQDRGPNPFALTRDALASVCAAGLDCFFTPDGGACLQACDPLSTDAGCPAGQGCAPDPLTLSIGYCFPLGGAGCLAGGYPSNELAPCASAVGCACPLGCFNDTGVGGRLCEIPCQTSDGCGAAEICRGGSCEINFCAQDLLGRSLNGPRFFDGCDADGVDPVSGTCEPIALGQGPTATVVGLCLWNGLATTGQSCAPLVSAGGPSRSPANRICVAGDLCVGPGTLASCARSCDPTGGGAGGCTEGQACHAVGSNDPRLGLCGGCSLAGQRCQAPNDCCSGGCDSEKTGTCL
jgi:hypothetical protein